MSRTISILFLASAALHAAVLGLIRFEAANPIQAGSPLRVSIQMSAATTARDTNSQTVETTGNDTSQSRHETMPSSAVQSQPQKRPPPTIKPVTTQSPQRNHTSQTTVAVRLNPDLDSMENTSASTKKSAPSPSEQSLSLSPRTVSLLRVDLEQAFTLHFYYPRLAVKRGWQGEVHLGLHVNANGRLTGIHILRSSGYSLLDTAAIKSLNKVEALPNAIALLNGKSMDLILPVSYQLL